MQIIKLLKFHFIIFERQVGLILRKNIAYVTFYAFSIGCKLGSPKPPTHVKDIFV